MNFLKKHWVTILIIVFFSIVIIIGFFEGINEAKQEQKSLSNYHKELEDDKESNQSSRTKLDIEELPKSKIKITQEKFNQITYYVLSENENEILTLSDLSPEEKSTIEKARKSQKQMLEIRKKRLEKINEYQKKCDDLKRQIELFEQNNNFNQNENKIKGFNNMLQRDEEDKNRLVKDYNNIENIYPNPLENINSLYEITPYEG